MKHLFTLLLVFLSCLGVSAQHDGDKITINTTEQERTPTWNLAGTSNVISSLKHTADGKLEIYLKDWEEAGAWETYDIN